MNCWLCKEPLDEAEADVGVHDWCADEFLGEDGVRYFFTPFGVVDEHGFGVLATWGEAV